MQVKSETNGTPYEHLSPERNLFDVDNVRVHGKTKTISRAQNIPFRPATMDGRIPVLRAGGKPSVPENNECQTSSEVQI